MLIINEDNSHFFTTRAAGEMTKEGLRAFVDQYAFSSVTHLFLCPNAMRASFRSRVRDAIWDPVEGKVPESRWPLHARLLYERGLDPYAVWIERCRERGLSPWVSMRMNDIHSVDDPENFMHSTFWRRHPEMWRVPHGSSSPWWNRALNYAHEAVRSHQMAFVEELLDRYDMDGLELDWMRFGYHLTPGKEDLEAGMLTEFVAAVRRRVDVAAERRGHRIGISVRVPAHPEAAAGLGMDGVSWAREGLVDMLVPCPFWSSTDFDIPVELWKEALGEAAASVLVVPGVEYQARPWPGGEAVRNDLASLRGFAASAWHRGADGLYLFNWMDSETRPVDAAAYRHLVEKGLDMPEVLRNERRHPVCYRDTVPAGFPDGVCLPFEACEGRTVRLSIGPEPGSGEAVVMVGLARRDDAASAGLRVSANGISLSASSLSVGLENLGGGAAQALVFSCPAGSLRSGENEIRVDQPAGPSHQVVWLEIRIFPRGGVP